MTTNQTIDGVPRELLERIAESGGYVPRRAELRALLDAKPVMCHGCMIKGVSSDHFDSSGKCKAAQPQGEPVAMAQGVGILTFMRSTGEGANRCGCCEGDHIFCRYFEGLPHFNDLTEELRHRNDLEGREFRVTVEVLAQQPAPVAVVLPERMEPRDPYDDEANQCNACLDEVIRLNTK